LKQDMAANDISITAAQKDAAKIDYSVKLASAVSELGGALSSISQGIGRLISAHLNLMASMSDVEAKRSANTKEIADIDQQTANEYMGQWRDLLNQISSNFKEMMMSSIQTETSAAKNMS
ncbi:MAG: hypothetical protein JWQ23_1861, partial [Herminiimonas sp.]|nr:hypothetical protein [Herminiimonas sp.]